MNARDGEGTEFSHDTKSKIELFFKRFSHQTALGTYTLAIDMIAKFTPRESQAILYFSSRVPRTSTEEQLHTSIDIESKLTPRESQANISLRECPARALKNNYALVIDVIAKLTPCQSQAILYLSSRVPRTSIEEHLRTRS